MYVSLKYIVYLKKDGICKKALKDTICLRLRFIPKSAEQFSLTGPIGVPYQNALTGQRLLIWFSI
jgi:hypothetical protein